VSVQSDRQPASPLRVLMTTPLYLPHMGGVERYVDVLSQRLVEKGLDVTVLTTDPSNTLPTFEQTEGVKVIRVPAWPRGRDYHFAPEVYRKVCGENWDVVHVQSYHTLVAPLAMLAARRANLPYVLTFHGGGHSSGLRRALRKPQWALLRPLAARANRLVAIASFEIELYGRVLRVPPERFALIPNGTDVAPDRSRQREANSNGALIVSVGRLERYKGHHRLIQALPQILRSRPDARVWIAGSGPYEQELGRMARKLGVGDRVEIRAIAADRPEEMASRLSEAALVVLLSDYETQPLAVLEALALGLPVLVTHTTGLGELANRGLVRSVPAASGPNEVAAAILEQLRDPFVPPELDLPSWDDCAVRHQELYASLTTGRRQAS
jgi:glycosyltransferase involved in cell wall biosynthesis